MFQKLISLEKKAVRVLRKLSGKPASHRGPFYNRIQERNAAFWKAADVEQVRYTVMQASDPLEKWQDRTNWQRKLSNKYNAREFAIKCGCRVADLYWSGRDLSKLDFSKVPQHYVIRPTIGYSSKMVYLMDGDFNMMDKRRYTTQEITQALANAIEKNPNLNFLVEEFLKNEAGEYKIPNDYKVYAFNGEIACIQVINRLSPSKGFTTFYDENWRALPQLNTYYPKGKEEQPPKCFAEMVAQAKNISKVYGIFARFDFYATDKGVVFGEFTPTPFMGHCFTPEADKLFLHYWDTYCKGLV